MRWTLGLRCAGFVSRLKWKAVVLLSEKNSHGLDWSQRTEAAEKGGKFQRQCQVQWYTPVVPELRRLRPTWVTDLVLKSKNKQTLIV